MSKAYVFTRHGGPETETFTDRKITAPGPGQLLIAVRAAGVNPVDWKQRDGYTRPGAEPTAVPAVFGNEASGVVEEVGAGVEGFSVGDAVFGSPVTGGYAEHTLLLAEASAPKPDAVSFTVAATLPVAAATAYDAIRQLAPASGATLLINGIGGGVGIAAAQLARGRGLRVVGTASVGKRELVESLGAIHVPSGPGVAERVQAASPNGVDALLDLVGGPGLDALAALLSDRTRLVSGADKDRAVRLGGSAIDRVRTRAVYAEVAELVASGVLRPLISRTFPLDRAPEALRTIEEGHVQGKIVIEVGA